MICKRSNLDITIRHKSSITAMAHDRFTLKKIHIDIQKYNVMNKTICYITNQRPYILLFYGTARIKNSMLVILFELHSRSKYPFRWNKSLWVLIYTPVTELSALDKKIFGQKTKMYRLRPGKANACSFKHAAYANKSKVFQTFIYKDKTWISIRS